MQSIRSRGRPRAVRGGSCAKARSSTLPMSQADPDYDLARRRSSAELARCSACRCCAKDMPIGVLCFQRQEVRAIHRQADRAGDELRRPGGDRHREHAAAQTRSASNLCSSRPPPPMCSRSSAARPSICRPCSIRWSNSAARLCDAESAPSSAAPRKPIDTGSLRLFARVRGVHETHADQARSRIGCRAGRARRQVSSHPGCAGRPGI